MIPKYDMGVRIFFLIVQVLTLAASFYANKKLKNKGLSKALFWFSIGFGLCFAFIFIDDLINFSHGN